MPGAGQALTKTAFPCTCSPGPDTQVGFLPARELCSARRPRLRLGPARVSFPSFPLLDPSVVLAGPGRLR